MSILQNEIMIDAPIEKIWGLLSNVEELDKYDPTVKKTTAVSLDTYGINAKRKVDMLDGKNWFEEKVVELKENESLAFELTACSFPIERLKHSYTFEQNGTQVKVKQIMDYKVKYGIFGKLLDLMIVRKQSDNGIKQFMTGLKSYAENK